MVRSVARNLTMEASQKQPICKPGRRKRRSKNEPVLMVYRVPYNYDICVNSSTLGIDCTARALPLMITGFENIDYEEKRE